MHNNKLPENILINDNPSSLPFLPENILVVDDSPSDLRFLVEVLKRRGYKVWPAPNGTFALFVAQEHLPDLILLDIRMKEMDGYTVCEQLKADKKTRNIPVIFLSALDQVADKVKAFTVGGVDYITKPFHKREVLARVETHLTLRRLQEQLEKQNAQLQQEIIERQQAEEKLQSNLQFLETLIDTIPIPFFYKDGTGRYLGCNTAFSNFAGKTPEEMKGKTVHETWYKELADIYYQTDQELMHYGGKQNYEAKIRRKDGLFRDVICNKAAFFEANGKIGGIVGTFTDITERKQTEEKLAKREANLATLVKIQQHLLAFEGDSVPYYEILERLGAVSQANRIYIVENHYNSENHLLMNQLAEWRAEDFLYEIDYPQLPNLPYNQFFPRWIEILEQGNIVSGRVMDFPENEQPILESLGILSILILPLTVGSQFFGFIGFDSCRNDEPCASWQVSLLQSVAAAISFALEHQQAAQALKWSQQRFATVLNSIEAVIYVADMKTYELLFVNQFGRKLFGEIEGKFCWQSLQTKQIGPCEFCTNPLLVTSDGQSTGVQSWEFYQERLNKWFYIQDQAILWIDGRLVRLAIATDVTEHKKAEEALRKSEAILKETQRLAKLGGWEFNIASNQLIWTEEVYRIHELPLDYQPNVEKSIHFYAPEHIPVIKQAVQKAIQEGDPFDLQLKFITAKNHQRWVRAIGQAHHQEGKIAKLTGLFQDITERKRTEEALTESEMRYRSLFENAGDAIFVHDLDGVFLDVNQVACQRLGYSYDEMLVMCPQDIDKEECAKKVAAIIKKITEEGQAFFETVHVHRNGSMIPTEICARLIQYKGQKAVLSIARDITERKQTEVVLQQAKEAAEAANRAKSTFLTNMSHELRTPLNGILGYTQLFLNRDKQLNETQREGIRVIHRCGEHLLMLINDILDLSKVEAGKLELIPTDFRFPLFLQDIADLFKIRAEQQSVAFSYNSLSYLPTFVHADEKRLRQILLNLLSNAIKFTSPQFTGGRKGTVTFSVICYNNRARFEIEDTGKGIASNHLENIFLPFQQEVDDQVRYPEGTGLGLSVSKKLVEMMGGQLLVSSIPNQGSIFWFEVTLPEVLGIADKSSSVQSIIVGFKKTTKTSSEEIKILVVDDVKEHSMIIVTLLSELGFTVLEANNGTDALKIALKWLPEMMIVDLVMPNMDGFELTRRIRQSPNTKEMVVIGSSASVFQKHRSESLKAGCNEFIGKPINTDVLLDLLQKYLPLEWTYDMHNLLSLDTQSTTTTVSLREPSSEQAEALFKLVIRGDIEAIIENALQLEQYDAGLSQFAEQIRKLAKSFRMEDLKKILKPYFDKQIFSNVTTTTP